jgi:glycosyltransferase involved in cell wall biosynthesis
MAAGLPVVAVPAAGTPELVVHCSTGLLSPAGDEGSLLRHLEALIVDGDLRRRLGRPGRRGRCPNSQKSAP